MKKALLLFTLIYSALCFGQTIPFSPAQVQEDLQYLHQQLKKHHPNLYVYASKAQLDSTIAAMIKEADHPMSEQELYAHITRLSAIIKDGHTLFFPASTSLEYHNNQSLFFPFKVFYHGDKLYVELNCSLSDEIANGTEIVSINGLPAEQVIQFCLDRMMRDGHNLNYPIWILNQYFAEYYSYFYGYPSEFLLELKTSGGENRSVTVAALPKAKIREIRAARFPNRVTARGLNQEPGTGILLKIDILRSIATLSIRDFDSDVLKTVYQQDFKKTIGYLFTQIQQAQIKHLIIDLRGNQGGNLENGTFLLSHLLPEKFKVVEQFNVVKNPEAATEQERNALKKGRGTQLNPPQAKPFLGPIYLLVNGGSFSNSGIVSSAFRHYQRGKIIGEETGGNKSVICGWEEAVTLPFSKISVYIPTRQFLIRDRVTNNGHGVIPDFIVRPTIQELANGKDEVLDFTLNLIQN